MMPAYTEQESSKPAIIDDHDLGLQADLTRFLSVNMNRRKALMLGGLGSAAILAGCGSDGGSSSSSSSSTTSDSSSTSSGGSSTSSGGSSTSSGSTSTTTSCGEIPNETAGPYPGDGSNGQNALTLSGIVRQNITASLSTGKVATGIPLTLKLKLVNINASCAALAGYAIYLWHCDKDGNYSMYSNGITGEDYLRGVQETDSDGMVTFTSIFPGCYSGRWPHVHFEVYPSLGSASSYSNKIKTSQLALPQSAASTVYATTGYESSVTNLANISLSSDNVFSDGVDLQLSEVTGNTTDGFVATLVVGISI